MDAGLGVSLAGFTAGAQTGLYLLRGAFTPFVAAGAHTHISSDTDYADDTGSFTAEGHPAVFADLNVGGAYLREDGLSTSFAVGWAQLVTRRPYTITGGTPTQAGRQAVDLQYGGGVMFSVMVGYAY